MLNRRAFSDLIPDNPYGSRRKEEIRQVEFVRFGQVKNKTVTLNLEASKINRDG